MPLDVENTNKSSRRQNCGEKMCIEQTDTERIQELHRQILIAMGNLNDMEKTISRLKKELLEVNDGLDDAQKDG